MGASDLSVVNSLSFLLIFHCHIPPYKYKKPEGLQKNAELRYWKNVQILTLQYSSSLPA